MFISSLKARQTAQFWWVTLSAVLVAALCFALGLWQMDRAAQKEQQARERTHEPVLSLQGRWQTEQTVYVDNRQMMLSGQLRQGFFVVTPLLLSAQEYVLVLRGWIPRNFVDRKNLAPIETPHDVVTLSARSVPDPVPPKLFSQNSAQDFPIVGFVDLEAFKKAMPKQTYKGMVQQIGPASEGLLRDWYRPESSASKNYGYAFQWFALCATVVFLYVWFQWIKK